MKKPLALFLCLFNIVLFSINVSGQCPVLSPTIKSENPVTCNGSDGSITISGLTANDTYIVSYKKDGIAQAPLILTADGSGTIKISGLSAGFYFEFSLDAGGCTTNLFIGTTLTNPVFFPTFPPVPSFCAGTAAPVLPSVSNNGITGTWNPPTIDNQTSASYTFTPDANQCGIPVTVNVTVNPRTTPTFTFGTSLSICAGGSVPALPNTSQNGITGTWNPATVDNQNSGTYTFSPDAGQCTNPATFTVTVAPNITPTFSFGTSLSVCAGETVPSLPATSDNGITGSWSPATVDNQNSGTYTFTPDAGQCATATTFDVTVNPVVTPTFNFGTSLSVCSGASVPTLPTTSQNGITGTWSPSAVDNLNSGVYTFTPDAGQCAASTTFTVTINPNITPTFAFGTNLSICKNGSVPALPTTSTNGINGVWTPATIDNQNSGSYLFVPTAGQCATTATLTVTVNPNITPTFDFGTSLTICKGGTVPALPMTSLNGVIGTWSPATVDNQNSGTYTFTPMGAQCATTATLTVTVNPNVTPTFSFGTALSICAGGSVPTLPATSQEGITGTWNPAVVDNQTSNIYEFTPDAGQCAMTTSFSVTVAPNVTPTFSFGTSLSICAGATVPLLPTTSDNGITGTWSAASIDNQNSATYTFTPDAGQCAIPASLSVTVNPNVTPSFSFGPTLTICEGGTVPLLPTTSDNGITGTWTPAVADNQNSGTYTFTPDAGQCVTPGPITFSVTVTPNITPVFSLDDTLTICNGGIVPALPTTSDNGLTGTWTPVTVSNTTSGSYIFTSNSVACAVPDTFTVIVNPIIKPTFSFGTFQSLCIGASVPVLPATSDNGISGTWNPAVVDNSTNGTYVFTPDAGQCADTASFKLEVNAVPTVTVRADTTVYDGDFLPAFNFIFSPGATVNWTNSNPSIGLQASGTNTVPSFTATNMSDQPVTATITATPVNGGCTGLAQTYVIKVLPLNKDVFVPNVFTPNGDGKNDVLYVYGNYITKVDMHIFNQWGQQIATISNKIQGWDGKYKGTPQPVGVYVYVLKAELSDGRTVNMKGSITLLR
jgi:gliding motility-associated-like protein